MSRLLSIVPTETETTSIVLNGPIEGHLIIFHQTKVKFYQIILQPQQKTAPHLVQNAVFTQTGGGSGNNHHHLRHHNQHHITIIIKRCIVPATPVSGSCLQIPLNWQGGGKRFFFKSPLLGEVVEH